MALKILLADDSMTAQNMGKKILSDAGYEVIAVSNGAAALKKIQSEKPDIVVLDVYMPGYNGLEVCEKIKNSPETAMIPVLLTVGKMEPFRSEEANRVKADGVMIKPFEASDLTIAIANICSHNPESASASKPKSDKKTDSVASAAPAVPAPVKSHDDTIRLTREELKQIREASYQDWGSSTLTPSTTARTETTSAIAAAAVPASQYLESESAVATAHEASTSVSFTAVEPEAIDITALELTTLDSSPAASWEVGLPEFVGNARLTSEDAILPQVSDAMDSTTEWGSAFQSEALPVVDDIPEMPPLSAIDLSASGLATEDAIEAFSANVDTIAADETADFAGPLPDVELTAVQREDHTDIGPSAEPSLIANTDSNISEFVTQFGVSTPTTVSPDELNTYVAENNEESADADTFSALLRNHHIATEIPEANLPDLVAQERERADEQSNADASNETYAELMHSNDFDVQSLSELDPPATTFIPEATSFAPEAESASEAYVDESASTTHVPAESTANDATAISSAAPFTQSTVEDCTQEVASQTGVFQDWQSDEHTSEQLSVAANSVISDAQVHLVSSFHPSPLIESSTPGISDTGLAWETASQCDVLVAQPQAESDLETESMATETMKPSSSFSAEPLMSAVVENVDEITARYPRLTEEAIARAFSRVLDRFKDQLVSELAKELAKE